MNIFTLGACFQHKLHTGPYLMTFAPRLESDSEVIFLFRVSPESRVQSPESRVQSRVQYFARACSSADHKHGDWGRSFYGVN